VMPEGPGDLSRCDLSVFLSFWEGVWQRLVHFSHRRVRGGVGKGDGPGRIESSAN